MALCGQTNSTVLYNLGMDKEVSFIFPVGYRLIMIQWETNYAEAETYFRRALESGRKAGYKQGQLQAADAIRRIKGNNQGGRS